MTILPAVQISKLSMLKTNYSGIDSLEHCVDQQWFQQWQHPLDYQYNSRGFRDQEWPLDLVDAIWCIGDSFTAGVGSPFSHTWPQVLAQHTGRRVINVSLDGGSNDWISRNCQEIYSAVEPRNIVIMWSYIHRRENNNNASDLNRRMWHVKSTVAEDFENFKQCRQQIKDSCKKSNIVEMIIPNWEPALSPQQWQKIRGASWSMSPPVSMDQIPSNILEELINIHQIDIDDLKLQFQYQADQPVVTVPRLDLARDGHHFDISTSEWVAAHVAQLLAT